MSFFEIEKDALLRLSDEQLEELIARLAEAEVSSNGGNLAEVRWAGSINAPDGGVDIRVAVTQAGFTSGFIPKPKTIFQAKKHSMPFGAITSEMCPKGILAATISEQAKAAGAYIIVSLADNCSPPMYEDRLKAMRAALDGDPHRASIHLDFFDRSKLHQWLRQHPSVMLWVMEVLGQALSGWHPYGSWSNTPTGFDDGLITLPGVSVILPAERHTKLSLAAAIDPTRELVRTSTKCIRITGLSGVGKTRFVQALFDETIGTEALDRTLAIYVDVGDDPDPSARAMLDRLKAEGKTVILVLDNCPTALHSDLAARVAASVNHIKLITVEYDIRDDKPQTTEVVHIEADGPEIAEALLQRRYSGLGQVNARRIAEFADGNARVSLALAERVEVGESLAQLTDMNLFGRLFQQRNKPDGQLRIHAEALSLVYSFAVDVGEDGIDELSILGSLCDATQAQLFRSTATMLSRHIAQKRGRWRAILPHAIANPLAASALDSIPITSLRSTFEHTGRKRLLRSFAHRLGLMHDHPIAQQIVRAWLAEGGPLAVISTLDDEDAQILDFVAPVAPDTVLDRIEAEINADEFSGLKQGYNTRRTTILNLLVSLAYEQDSFDRCVRLLLRVAEFEDPSNNQDAVRDKVIRFFQPYLSGTHATLAQRETVLRACLWSHDHRKRDLGLRLLSAALDGPPWMGAGTNDFGARPRDFGFEPNSQQLVSWRHRFIDIAVEAGLSDNLDLSQNARLVLAKEFRGLWGHAAVRGSLVDAAHTLHSQRAWSEGWKAVRSTIYFNYRVKDGDEYPMPIPKDLSDLKVALVPTDLPSRINTFVLGKGHDLWSLDDHFDDQEEDRYSQSEARLNQIAYDLGEEFSQAGTPIDTLGKDLFSNDWMPYRTAFGKGLAAGAINIQDTWEELSNSFRAADLDNFNFSVLYGFLEQLNAAESSLAQSILDRCVGDPILRKILVGLHPIQTFNEADLDRCMLVFDFPDVDAWRYADLLWRNQPAALPTSKLINLANKLLEKVNGDNHLLHALSMKLHGADPKVDTLGHDLRRIGLIASTKRFLRSQDDAGGSTDHDIARVLEACFAFNGAEDEKTAWLDAIFDIIDQRHGYLHAFDDAVRVTVSALLEPFMDRLFPDDEKTRRKRQFFIEHGTFERLPLASIEAGRIIYWCNSKSDDQVWAVVASGISPFDVSSENELATISVVGLRFLEACPNPEHVLASYANKITPSSWSGSRAAIMERHAAAFESLQSHKDARIADASRRVMVQAKNLISKENERERREDEAQEQRFE